MFWKKAGKEKKPEKNVKSSFVRAACKLGLLSAEDAVKADAMIEADPAAPSQDIVVQAGMLTKEQVEQVNVERKAIDTPGFLADLQKKAHAALEETHDSSKRLFKTITQPVSAAEVGAARKKAGIA